MTVERYNTPLVGGPLDGKRAAPMAQVFDGEFGRYELSHRPIIRGDEVDFELIYRFIG